jgi:hypothetical protein
MQINNAAKKVPGALPIPLSSTVQQLNNSPQSLPRYNEIVIALEKARVESERAALQRAKVTDESKVKMIDITKKHREGNRPGVLNVLIASPSDVSQEREAVASAIRDWNASHAHPNSANILLNAIRWETHSYPQSGEHPQTLLNAQIVEEGDILIGVFWSRLGTPTEVAESGTLEEIEQFRQAGKYVALYFSDAPLPQNHDREQFDKLMQYKNERKKDTLYAVFSNPEELRQKVYHHLTTIVTTVAKPLGLGMWSGQPQTSSVPPGNTSSYAHAGSVTGWKPDAHIEVAADQTRNELILKSHLPFTLLSVSVQTKEGVTLAELPIEKGEVITGYRVHVNHAAMLKVKQMEKVGGLEDGAKGRIAYRVERAGQIYEHFLPFVTEDVIVNSTVHIKLLG